MNMLRCCGDNSNTQKAIQQNMLALEMSLRELLRNFGLRVRAISSGRFEHRIRELVDGNAMLEHGDISHAAYKSVVASGTCGPRKTGPANGTGRPGLRATNDDAGD